MNRFSASIRGTVLAVASVGILGFAVNAALADPPSPINCQCQVTTFEGVIVTASTQCPYGYSCICLVVRNGKGQIIGVTPHCTSGGTPIPE